ncbi:ATP-binding protein [Pseudoalteromonas luteoviolacea]|uniref:ATP-binding protein n=1 Tax=Pseudoalteromonas luteoviolacea TaxID=43657 RepID=UPI00114F2B5A|nr:ATP-binding protein [Pseudoalteromonas luteoviolacea]TQF67956.1 two-component sensor histidine kinase [Pseudoalteromonas luteoviolacea]
MLRLLVSLYLFVFASIIFINQSSEYIWKNWGDQTPDELNYAKQVALNLKSVLDDIGIESQTHSEQLNVVNINDIAWFPEQIESLQKGEVVVSFDANDHYQLSMLLADGQHLVQLGPYAPQQSSFFAQYGFRLVSFSILALLLVLWLRPLWRDLTQLKHITTKLATGQLDIESKPSRFSAISTLTQQIQKLALQTASLMQNQKHLVNAVSHELRTPLARLKFALAMLAAKDPKQVQAMSNDVLEMELLIDEMLSYARLEFSEREMQKSIFDFSQLVIESIDKVQSATHKKLQLEIQNDLYVFGSSHYLSRVLQNLLQNADKYGAELIDVHLASDNRGNLHLTVSDDGPGIPQDKRENVFSPFIRLETSRSKETGGFGLGLAIVAKILGWHDGHCWVSDSSLGGATFNITIPLKQN